MCNITHRKYFSIFLCLILIGCIGSYLYFVNNDTQYDMYEKDNKHIGILQHYTQEQPGSYYISLYYPQFKDPVLAKTIESYKEAHLQIQPSHTMQYIAIDYAADRICNRFIRITFIQTIRNDKKILQKEEVIHYTYDEQSQRLLTVNDILQGDYKQSLQAEAEKQHSERMEVFDENNFQVEEDGILFYDVTNAKKHVYYAYDTYAQYFKLKL